MRINRVECDQFAGTNNREFNFEKGLNLVVGENESGKSTLVDLIYHLLFKDTKLSGKSDKDFLEKYFPKKVSGPNGDVIDGVLEFETSSGTYKIKREWEQKDGSTRLTLPDGTTLKGKDAIAEVLSQELEYGAGVFSEIVFASQKREQMAIRSIMKAIAEKDDKTRTDLTSTLTGAALETGGVSLEELEKGIKANKESYEGKWDFEADAPQGASTKKRWSNGAGKLVEAYYQLDEARSKQKEAEEAEKAVDTENALLQALHLEKIGAEEKKEDFLKCKGALNRVKLLREAVEHSSATIAMQQSTLTDWPDIVRDKKKAEDLKENLRKAKIRKLFQKAEKQYEEVSKVEDEFKSLKEVDEADRKALRTAIRVKHEEEGKLAGINLAANIKKLGDHAIHMKTISSGSDISVESGEVAITEAVIITIPGIMELQLMPQGINVQEVQDTIRRATDVINAMNLKYGVSSLEELEEKADHYTKLKHELDHLRQRFESTLEGDTWENLKKINAEIPQEIETEEVIQEEITNLCKTKSIDSFIGAFEHQISEYEKAYTSVERLREVIAENQKEKEKKRAELDSLEEIPEEYKNIQDPDQYEEDLKNKVSEIDKNLEFHREKLKQAEMSIGEKTSEEYLEEVAEKERILLSGKTEYLHWSHIYQVFLKKKEELLGNPTEDLSQRFQEYLAIITDGALHLDSMDEKMGISISSGTHALSYGILSDGTKDTIALAFRLAMLEHLFPDGDGLAVFDDPFTDMDPKRVEKACSLIQRFAEKNQVIFITCDDKYLKKMNGHVIHVSR